MIITGKTTIKYQCHGVKEQLSRGRRDSLGLSMPNRGSTQPAIQTGFKIGCEKMKRLCIHAHRCSEHLLYSLKYTLNFYTQL